MKKGLKKTFAFLLSLCIMLGSAQISEFSVYAAEDGTIDTTEEGWETISLGFPSLPPSLPPPLS